MVEGRKNLKYERVSRDFASFDNVVDNVVESRGVSSDTTWFDLIGSSAVHRSSAPVAR
jgi:hypothetical protein